ncbi:MAG: endonuclease MutS2, partial [Bacilli bacterium]
VFTGIGADIGDEQSLEQSLSTFSSHMVHIVEMLGELQPGHLLLFDELGAGTDPQEGAALAISILDWVRARGAVTIATTHYPELKAYGYDTNEVLNASVEFDIDSLKPTYRLLLGVPGRSNAFEIAGRLGLDVRITDSARTMLSQEQRDFEELLTALERKRKEAENEWADAYDLGREAESLLMDLRDEWKAFQEKKTRMMERAEEEARTALAKRMEEAENIIAELRQLQREGAQSVKDHELIGHKKSLEGLTPERKKKVAPKTKEGITLLVGDEVRVTHLGQRGTLLQQVTPDEWVVAMGILKMKVTTDKLEFITRPKQTEKQSTPTVRNRTEFVSLELDLRGERFENAITRLEKYIDEALLANYPSVSIIHGHGTGALRQGVQTFLREHSRVKSMRFGGPGEGGLGVTVVELK